MEEVRQILSNEGTASNTVAARPTTLAFEAPNRGPSPLLLPLKPHWFYMKECDKHWIPFSLLDSNELENAHLKGNGIVTTCGGRFEVDLSSKKMYPVYWQEPMVIHARRCSWFYKTEGDTRYMPYDEDVAHILEETYQKCHNLNKWNRQIDIGGTQYVKMFNPNLMTHHATSGFTDEWGNISDTTPRPRMVKRGADNAVEGAFEPGESETIDHLIFVVHGIGAVCDFKMRTVEQCLDDFRSMSNQLIQNHFAEQFQAGQVGRVEFLPVSWHSKLHGETTGLDGKLQKITINTIRRVREFSNDTILDALLYTSPVYCQTIVDQVGSELNRLYHLFKRRNPTFNGTIGLAGHSLGSLILYDILSHQREASATPVVPPQTPMAPTTLDELFDILAIDRAHIDLLRKHEIDVKAWELMSEADLLALGLPVGPVKKIADMLNRYPRKALRRKHSYTRAEYLVQGNEGTGQLTVNYPQLEFQPDCFFAMGSPIAMFIVVRGNETLGKDYRLPTCPRFFNIYHPYDPIAYRMEPLIDSSPNLEPAQIPHHKGRKRIHLEVRESLRKVSTEVRQKIVGAVSVLSSSLQRRDSDLRETPGQDSPIESEDAVSAEVKQAVVSGWALNSGRRVDYVLQEGPFESFNEYLSVLFSHTCYWESEDTLLLMLKEHYALRGVLPTTATKYAPLIPFYPLSPTSPTEPAGKENEVGPFWSSVASITNYFSSHRTEVLQNPPCSDTVCAVRQQIQPAGTEVKDQTEPEEERPGPDTIDASGYFHPQVDQAEGTVYENEEAVQRVVIANSLNRPENNKCQSQNDPGSIQYEECPLQAADAVEQRQQEQQLMVVQQVDEGEQREQYVLLFRNDEEEPIETYVVEGELQEEEDHEEQLREQETAQPTAIRVNGKKCFKCDECEYVCKRRNYLKIHKQKVHVTPRELTCYLCQGNFASTAALYSHMGQVHAEELPFACDICGYRARARHRIVSHKLSHDKEPRYKCDFCSFATRHKYLKTQHEYTHQEEKPFSCYICEYKGRWRSSVYMHIKKRHGHLQDVAAQSCAQVPEDNETTSSNALSVKTHSG